MFGIFGKRRAEEGEPTADARRRALMREIDDDMRATAVLTGREALAPAVRRAILDVPREDFVEAADAPHAYRNRPLAIGHGQTISQPYIVALMTELLDPKPGDTVLEVGTGSGYQTAVLARIVGRVFSLEVVEPLADTARQRLARLGYGNVEVRAGDGASGWPEEAPFDAIVVTAAAPAVPQALIDQLKRGGRMVIPVGPAGSEQDLVVVEKDADGEVSQQPVLPVAFVPFTGTG